MPGQAGTATAPGQSRIAASTSPLPTNGTFDDAGNYASQELRTIGLSGLAINIDRLALGALGTISVAVQIRVDSDMGDWITLGIPCCCEPDTLEDIPAGAGGVAFVSWDHIAAREARFVATGVAGEALGRIILMATST